MIDIQEHLRGEEMESLAQYVWKYLMTALGITVC